MQSPLEIERLSPLLGDLYRITGLKFALHDEASREIYSSSCKCAFCSLIGQASGGYERCVACDRQHAACDAPDGAQDVYTCHAGLVEVAVPVYDQGKRVATVMFGQILEEGDREKQWESVRRKCAWYPDMAQLRGAFLQVRQMNGEEVRACADIVRACVSEARLTGMKAQAAKSDPQRVKEYLEAHYAQSVTLDRLSRELGVGKTRLCRVIREGTGETLTGALKALRVKAAAKLLLETDLSVQEIAEAVGIPDYNYFTKVFSRAWGMTPTACRHTRRPPV